MRLLDCNIGKHRKRFLVFYTSPVGPIAGIFYDDPPSAKSAGGNMPDILKCITLTSDIIAVQLKGGLEYDLVSIDL